MEWNLNRAHKVLGNLGRHATSKMAYRLESRRRHPDHHVGKPSFNEAEARMQTINAAYEYLRELIESNIEFVQSTLISVHTKTTNQPTHKPAPNKKQTQLHRNYEICSEQKATEIKYIGTMKSAAPPFPLVHSLHTLHTVNILPSS